MEKNKTGKYLKYAIGEIILVVIGILIALAINNWNETRKAFDAELQLYVKLLGDLNSEYDNTDFNINSIKNSQDVHYHVYEELKGRIQYDSTRNYNSLQWIFPYHLSITEKYIESLKSISNEEIRDLIKLYINREKNTKDAYDEWNKLKEQRLRPFFNKYGIHNVEGIYNVNRYNFDNITSVKLINNSKLKEQFGTTELDELLFDLRFKTSWVFSKLSELKQVNNRLEKALISELILTEQSENIIRIPRKQLYELLDEKKSIDEIIEIIKKENTDKPVYGISEDKINTLGYRLMSVEKFKEALKIFKLNTELYPNGFNTYDSYGDCLLKLGDTENAIKAYKKSLELNSDNTNAKSVLSQYE